MALPGRLLPASLTLVVVALLGTGVWWRLKGAEADDEPTASSILAGVAPDAAANMRSEIAIPVTGAKATRGTLILSVNASGQAQASRRTEIAPQATGRIRTVAARENATVAAGDVLFEIDPEEYDLRLREAELQLRQAEAAFEEQTLFDDRIQDPAVRADRQRNIRASSGLEAAEINLQRLRMEASRTRVTAPIAGRVADVNLVAGQWVSAGSPVMTIIALDPIRVEVQVLEGEIGYLSAGGGARVEFSAFQGEVFTGRIETVNPVVESGTRTARVSVLVPNPAGRILPGMYARVALDAREFPDRLMVPREAILERDDRRPMLFVFEPEGESGRGLAMWRYVAPGLANETHIEILPNERPDSTVAPGEVVLTDGHYSLQHQARVQVGEGIGLSPPSN